MLTSSQRASFIIAVSTDSGVQANMAALRAAQPRSSDERPTVRGCFPGIGRTAVRQTRELQGFGLVSGRKERPSMVLVTPVTISAIRLDEGNAVMASAEPSRVHLLQDII